MQTRIDQVLSGNQQAVAEECAGRQGGEDDVVVAVVELNRPVDAVAEDAVGAGKQGAVGEYFPHRAEGDEDKRKPCAHRRAVNGGGQDGVFRGVGFGAGYDDAVGDNQREVDAERLVERIGERLDEDFNDSNRARDEQHEHRNADFRTQPAAGGGNEGVGKRQDEDGRHAETKGVDGVGRGGEQRAEAEDLHQGGVVVPEAVGEGFAGFGGHGGAGLWFLCGAQHAADLVGDGARGDGRAGEAVDVAAVFFHGKAGVFQCFSRELQYPRVYARLDFVAQSGGFFVGEDAHAEQGFVVGGDADEQLDFAVVAFVGADLVVAAAVGGGVALCRLAFDGYGFGVVEQRGVNVGVDFAVLGDFRALFLDGDAVFGGKPGDADGGKGDGSIAGKAQGCGKRGFHG